jgi:hypothetical protein
MRNSKTVTTGIAIKYPPYHKQYNKGLVNISKYRNNHQRVNST